MLCCGRCFNDRGLRKQIIPTISTQSGTCPTCGATAQALVDAVDLIDHFESLCGIYIPSEDGPVLVDWLIEDWNIFAVERSQAQLLLVEILDDGQRVRRPVTPSADCKSDSLERWTQLSDELRSRNRFFPTTPFVHKRLEELLAWLMLDEDEWEQHWYRARIESDGVPFPADQMGAPPGRLASHGRANPVGIPYLYLASTPETAVAEVRPHPGQKACVAEFSIANYLRVVDLRNPRELVSPFLLGDESAIALMRGDIAFLERLGRELSTPVVPDAAAIDYIPSQYLCEFIKKCNYAGVIYGSSVGDGMNLALFLPDEAAPGDVAEYVIDGVRVSMSPSNSGK
ncbi:RES family NAD+ phosphorylase [Botrimarina mediterranea]|uniref:RES domain protein n=1 Tax=Botrimarina mediterranea TaxID=2528022 RepID=A0A518K246_9BACT|nr:RES family NAD+ phosphorylase [Botrimarina mediterranea]QDV71888.1 RES domain protein [Botrimarina mediterranea]